MCLWWVRVHKSWVILMLKMWKKMVWLERDAMSGMYTIAYAIPSNLQLYYRCSFTTLRPSVFFPMLLPEGRH
jgi:hypothetical protein